MSGGSGLLLRRERACKVVLKGGTNATLASQIDHAMQILEPTLRKYMGVDVILILSVARRGFFSWGTGGGEVWLETQPAHRV
jgi:RNA 3'-terminal phosphate cyclase (ATP)